MKKHFLILSLLGLLGCGKEEKPKPPAGLLPPGQLTSILADIHIAEARIEALQTSPDTARVLFERQQEEILKKKGISRQVFDKTYDYYMKRDLNALDKVYEALVDTLSMREVKLGGTAQPEPDPTQLK